MSHRSSRIVGVALAGGKSRRMGQDKAQLRLRGVSLVERTIACLKTVTDDVLIADRGLGTSPGAQSIPDGPGAGPVAGILGAAIARPDRDLLILACDLPAVPVALLRHLVVTIDEDAHVPRWRRGPEPLCARYRPAALAAMSLEVQAGHFALHAMLRDRISVRYLEGDQLSAFGPPERLFLNLNTPEDLMRLRRRTAASKSPAQA